MVSKQAFPLRFNYSIVFETGKKSKEVKNLQKIIGEIIQKKLKYV
jgi:hypothetical protein